MSDVCTYGNLKLNCTLYINFFHGLIYLVGLGFPIGEVLRSHSGRHTTLGRTPLGEWSACRGDLHLTTHNTHKRQTSRHQQDLNPHFQQASSH